MPKIRHQLGELPYRGGGISRAAPKIPLDESTKEATKEGHALLVPTENRSKKLLMKVKSTNGKDYSFQPAETTLHHDGCAIMYNV